MKRTIMLLMFALLSSSCSMTMEEIFLIPTTTPSVTITPTAPFTEIPTITPITPTLTFTVTPTLAGQRTATSTPDYTPTIQSVTPFIKFTPNTPTQGVKMEGFVFASASKKEFYKAGACEPTTVTFKAQVGNPAGTAFVQLFVRFKSKQTGSTSEWTSIKMSYLGAGTYIHELSAAEMKGVDYFFNAWVQYQFVATDGKINEVGRTDIFDEKLSLLECVPSPTPVESATITLTPPQ